MNMAQFIAQLGAQMAQGVHTQTPADGYMHAVGRFMSHASNWAAISASGLKCKLQVQNLVGDVGACRAPAIGVCVICEYPTCFAHALVAPLTGEMACLGCVVRARQQPSTPEPATAPSCSCNSPFAINPACDLHGQAPSAPGYDQVNWQRRKQHLRTLGLDESATWPDIKAAYKAAAAANHPDRASGVKRRRAEQKMRQINAAYEWLKEREAA